jgi:hypothetical protein
MEEREREATNFVRLKEMFNRFYITTAATKKTDSNFVFCVTQSDPDIQWNKEECQRKWK